MMHARSRLDNLPRRVVTLTLYGALFVAVVLSMPVLLIAALAIDLVRRRRLATLRCVGLVTLYLACEVAGIVASAALWVAAPALGGLDSERSQQGHYALQRWWAGCLYRGAERLYGLERRVDEGGSDPGRGPLVVFARHASLVDTIIPVVFLCGAHGLRLRYVLKRELLWDPCLDLVGNRIPNYFVRRGSSDTARETE
ncbi:MAG: hypothetical protein IT386_14600, partial [Deltaproteobacteria bacterium]|nr:hypothetical protein [Deltaproteobacteria bacterium]